MDKLQQLIDRIEDHEFSDVDEVYEAAIALSGKWEEPKITGIEKMVRALEVQVKEAKQSMEDCREYGVNSVGFNAYMGQMEMAETMLEEARRLAAEEAKECSKNPNVHEPCTDGKSEQTKEKPTAPDSLVEEFKKFAKDNELKSDLNGYAAGVIKEIIRKLEAQ